MFLSYWQPYFIALLIGLLVGIEREKSSYTQKTLGLRTFLLLSLLGAIAGDLENQWISAILTLFVLALIVVSYYNQTHISASDIKVDRGLTTEFAAAIIFCLGYAAHQSPALSATIGPIIAVILFSKKYLHRFTHIIKAKELKAALLLLLGSAIVINLTPNETIDPWKIFNPRKFGYLILTLATIEFSSYVLTKIIGTKKGSILVGFLGGLVSSTAVLLSSARQSTKTSEGWRTLVCSALAAKLAALVELLLIVGLISLPLLTRILFPTLAGLIVGGSALILIARKNGMKDSKLQLTSPLDWKGVFRLSLLLAAILALTSLAQLWIGERATFIVSFLTGLFELHGVSMASATMHSQSQLSLETASLSVFLALAASLLAKISMCWILSRGSFARAMTSVFLAMLIAIGLTGWIAIFNNI